MSLLRPIVLAIMIFAISTPSYSQIADSPAASPTPPTDLPLADFKPIPRANLPTTELTQARFPVVDVHSHFWVRLRHDTQQLHEFVKLMDRNNIAMCVSLDGQLGQGPLPGRLQEQIDYLWTDYRQRFLIFANINWIGGGTAENPTTWDCHQPEFTRQTILALEAAKAAGISGVKVFKSFGLQYRNPNGSLIEIDDSRFDAIWEACGRLGLPVIMHTADPSAFFEPITPENERYEELSRHPDWHYPPDKFPSRASLHAARDRLFARHRNTTFIAAHLGNDGEDLVATAQLLEDHPNIVIEIASRISELGRQPYSSRDFFIKYQDRILFGTDGPWPELRYQRYWRFLETKDEFFPYSEKPFPPQGFWQIYGIFLPDEVLKKIYYQNAVRIIPGVVERVPMLTPSP